MGFLSTLMSGSVGIVIDKVGDIIDDLTTTEEEKLQIKQRLEQIREAAKLQNQKLANEYETEITKRNHSDQIHGNFLTKSARPIFLYWVMFILSVLVFGGLNGITIDPAYIEMIKILAVTTVTFFFGSKGVEYFKHGRQI